METFSVTIRNDGRRETYELPQMDGLRIDGDEVELLFNPVHSGKLTLSCARSDLISVDIEV